jgi:MFS family permease
MSVAGDSMRESLRSLRKVAANPGLRRVNLALAGSLIGNWAYGTAVIVWAYDVGGPALVGLWAVVRFGVVALATPFVSVLIDRYPRSRVMVSSDLVRAALVTAAAAGLQWHWPDAVVFALATLSALAGSPFRPAQMALMPSLADEPEELTAANGVSSTLESLAFFVGPAIGGLLLGVASLQAVFLLNAASFLWSAALVARVSERRPREGAGSEAHPPVEGEKSKVSAWGEFVAGFIAIWRSPGLRVVVGLYCVQTVVAGAQAVFVVAIARDLLGLGAQSVGYLYASFGVGALIGGLVAIARASHHRLAGDFGVGVLLWALPLAVIWLWPTTTSAVTALAVMGAANSVVDVSAATVLQRLTPTPVMGRVFGALHTGLFATMGLGALMMPLLIHVIGVRWSLAVLAVVVSAVVLPAFPRLRRIDGELREPEALPVLRTIPLFSPLGEPLLQTLAQRIARREVAPGETIIEEGQPGEEFFVIGSGRVAVTQAGRPLREEGPGEFFGEIALLREVPRTATVTPSEPTVLYVLGRADFLDALTGNLESAAMAEDVVTRRLMT